MFTNLPASLPEIPPKIVETGSFRASLWIVCLADVVIGCREPKIDTKFVECVAVRSFLDAGLNLPKQLLKGTRAKRSGSAVNNGKKMSAARLALATVEASALVNEFINIFTLNPEFPFLLQLLVLRPVLEHSLIVVCQVGVDFRAD